MTRPNRPAVGVQRWPLEDHGWKAWGGPWQVAKGSVNCANCEPNMNEDQETLGHFMEFETDCHDS